GGRSWVPLVDRQNFDAMSLAVSRADAHQIFLAGHDVFQASMDGGTSWQPVAHNLPGSDIHGFAMSPDDPSHLYAYVADHGVFQSADSGRTWQLLSDQVPGDVIGLAAAGGNPETLYASSFSQSVLRSSDGGRTWSPVPDAPPAVFALAVDPSSHQTVYAGGQSGLSKSTDGGATWRKLPFPANSVAVLTVSPANPGVVLAISIQSQQALVYRSEDGGQSWSTGE